MTFWTCMLRCSDVRHYVGHTDSCDFTARRRPVTLVWSESFREREQAFAVERRIKGWTRAKKEALIAGDWALLHQLAKSREARPSITLGTDGGLD